MKDIIQNLIVKADGNICRKTLQVLTKPPESCREDVKKAIHGMCSTVMITVGGCTTMEDTRNHQLFHVFIFGASLPGEFSNAF
jgi:hypothetical protein